MAFKDTLKTVFLPLAMAASSLIAAPAHAVQMGADGCLPPAELMTQLKAEGQGSIVVAQRSVPKSANSPKDTAVLTFSTALKSGQFGKGYTFAADKPIGEPDFKFCISGEYNKARALDVSKSEIPEGVDANSNLAKVLNFAIKDKGFNPIYYGEKNGAITVIAGDPTKKDQLNGFIYIGNNDPKRPAGDKGGLINLGYSPTYAQSLASLNSQTFAAADMKPKP